ncbi:MAG: SH3 domain-containing protein, partial [Legionellales bacterium]|nr:SH3 domain-containing protein [Legionellales bacterium]
MQHIKNKILLILGILGTIILSLLIYRNYIANNIINEIEKESIKLTDFVNAENSQIQIAQDAWRSTFTKNYFSPWSSPYLHFTAEYMYERENKIIEKYTKNPGWGLDKHPYNNEWIKQIESNMQITNSFNTNKPAITTRTTDLRVLPTKYPSFTNWTDPGEGFPFDNLQESSLHSNLPIYVLHTSKDKEWSLVITAEKTYGWINNKDIAYVDEIFIKDWQSGEFVTATKYSTPLLHENNYQGNFNIGTLLPLKSEKQDLYGVKIAYKGKDGQAKTKEINISKDNAAIWPLKATAKNIATIANEFNNSVYGWGGILETHDCSSLVKDIFITVGYWLPRNSSDLALMNYINIKELSISQKENILIEEATPFFSLIWMRGHVMIYVGYNDKRETYSFHSIWGLRTRSLYGGKDGRNIIGKAIVQK